MPFVPLLGSRARSRRWNGAWSLPPLPSSLRGLAHDRPRRLVWRVQRAQIVNLRHRLWRGFSAISVAILACSSASKAQGPQGRSNPHFELCGAVRTTCVVDGDTFWLQGQKIRVADIDTPEVGEPRCDAEHALGMRATRRLRELLNAGPFDLVAFPGRDQDKYGRYLRVVVRGGRSLGDQLVAEGLARTWSGRREPWC